MELGKIQNCVIALANSAFLDDLKKLHHELPNKDLRLRPTAITELSQPSANFGYKERSYLSLLSENVGLLLEELKIIEPDAPSSSTHP